MAHSHMSGCSVQKKFDGHLYFGSHTQILFCGIIAIVDLEFFCLIRQLGHHKYLYTV